MGIFEDDLEWKCEFIKNDDKTWTWSVVRDRHIYESSISTTLNEAREVAWKALDKHKKVFEKGEKHGKREKRGKGENCGKGKDRTSSTQRGSGADSTGDSGETE